MGYPGDQGQSGGRHLSSTPPDEAPYSANNPYSFPPSPVASPGEQPGDPGAPGGFGRPGPYDMTIAHERGDLRQAAAEQQRQPGQPGQQPPWGSPSTFQPAAEPISFQQGPQGDPFTDHGGFQYGPGPQGGDGFGPPEEYGRSRDGKSRSRLPLIIGGGAAVVVVFCVIGLGVGALNGSGGSGKKTAATAPAASPTQAGATNQQVTPSVNPTAPLHALLKTRKTDPSPLTLGEIFKNDTFGKYTLAASSTGTNCGKFVHGSKFAAALKSGDCTQLLRATYYDSANKIVGTIGIANLSTAAAAKNAVKAGAGKDAYLLPLSGKTATSKKLGGTAVAQGTAEANGHYLIMTWIQRPDGKDFSAAQKKAITAFVTQVPLGSNLDTALNYRGMSGKPDVG